VELGGSVGEEQAQYLRADLGEEDGEQVHNEWLIQSDDRLKRAKRKASGRRREFTAGGGIWDSRTQERKFGEEPLMDADER
jgi:hypothetical protein